MLAYILNFFVIGQYTINIPEIFRCSRFFEFVGSKLFRDDWNSSVLLKLGMKRPLNRRERIVLEIIKYIYRLAVDFSNRTLKKMVISRCI